MSLFTHALGEVRGKTPNTVWANIILYYWNPPKTDAE